MEDKEKILIKLWELKDQFKLTDKDLEKEIGVDRMTIWRWRKHGMKPSSLAIANIKRFIRKHNVPK